MNGKGDVACREHIGGLIGVVFASRLPAAVDEECGAFGLEKQPGWPAYTYHTHSTPRTGSVVVSSLGIRRRGVRPHNLDRQWQAKSGVWASLWRGSEATGFDTRLNKSI